MVLKGNNYYTKQTQADLCRSNTRTDSLSARLKRPAKRRNAWSLTCALCTCLIPSVLLRCFGMKNKEVQSAWREKFTLCGCIMMACVAMGLLTYCMNKFVCVGSAQYVYSRLHKANFDKPYIIANGQLYLVAENHKNFADLSTLNGTNLTSIFPKNASACKAAFGKQVMAKGHTDTSLLLNSFDKLDPIAPIHYTWSDVQSKRLIVVNNAIYDASYCNEPRFGEFIKNFAGKDATAAEHGLTEDEFECFKQTFYAGKLETKTFGCLFADLLLYLSTVAIFGLIFVRFILSCLYSWSIRLKLKRIARAKAREANNGGMITSPVVMLVTCFTEPPEEIKKTLDSLAQQDYPRDYRVIFLICDGLHPTQNGRSTTLTDICMLFTVDERPAPPCKYVSLVEGLNRYNRAVVKTGVYSVEGRPETETKIVVICKVGTTLEEKMSAKGNRGKRDSQVILMGYFSRVLYRDRLTPLDVDIHGKLRALFPHVKPDGWLAVLMVDADTEVERTALTHILNVFDSDFDTMGGCGETRIANKTQSWVTMIQVFEYYISHHLTKSFESVFGGVTCLPGCFCAYKLRTYSHTDRKRDAVILPLLANVQVLNAYSSTNTRTLHQKNLLLLGEDRYLTTLCLKTLYRRKLVFIPQARCQTDVPASFSVLLSQRRRWINSTVHNLFELVLVDRLCGTFCCSMQFVIALELIGTLVLPAAIIFTGVLIAVAVAGSPAWLPLIMLAAILGLPAVLILLTTMEVSYVFWIVIYIISLPIWNLILPTYAFWNFDDFSWGSTVTGGDKHNARDEAVSVEEKEASELKTILMTPYEDAVVDRQL